VNQGVFIGEMWCVGKSCVCVDEIAVYAWVYIVYAGGGLAIDAMLTMNCCAARGGVDVVL
jgi:hypothetical protein